MLCVKGGLCYIDGTFVNADILIDGGKIAKVARDIGEDLTGEEVIDAENCLVIPSFFNSHTHAAMTLLRCVVEDRPLMEWLREVWKIEGRMSDSDVYAGTRLAILEMIKTGCGCFSDQYFHMDAVARAVEESGVRAVLGYGMIDMGDEEKREKELREARKFIEGWKDRCDRIGLSVDPHSPYTCSEELIRESLKLAEEYSLPVHIHVAETEWEVNEILNKKGMRPVEYLDSLNVFRERTIIAHGVWLSDGEIELLAKKGVSVAHCPVSNLKLGSGIARVADLLKAGVNVCLGTDGAASNNSLNMLEEMKFAVLLQKIRSGVDSISTGDFLRMATENGYKAYGIKGGRIETGYLADIAILEKSFSYTPLYNPVYSIVYSSCGFEVRDLIVNGEVVMRNRDVLTMDEEEVIDEAERRGFNLVL